MGGKGGDAAEAVLYELQKWMRIPAHELAPDGAPGVVTHELESRADLGKHEGGNKRLWRAPGK